MGFDSIIGQQEIIAGLKNSIKYNRVGHAYIFNGPKGIGKKTLARAFAGILLCEKKHEDKTCGECLACRTFSEESNPDFHVIEPGGTSIGVEEIRDMQADIIIKPLYSGTKVYLIIEGDKMTPQAQNCLLKTLEEPPGHSVIIITASNPENLLETVRSRTVRYNFKKNKLEEVREFLSKNAAVSDKETDFIASFADGVIGTAVELAESEEFTAIREKTIETILKLKNSKLLDIFTIFELFDSNKTNIHEILDIMTLFYRDMLVRKKSDNENVLINSDKKDIILSNVSEFSVEKLAQNLETIEIARRNLKQNANYQLTMEVMLMKLQEEST